MHPTLRGGDGLDLYIYRNPDELRVGDVIVYPHPFGTVDVVHRIIEIKPDGVITRGDNNNKIDPYTVQFKDIIGKVLAAKRKDRLMQIKGGKTGFCIHKLMLFRKGSTPLINWRFWHPWGMARIERKEKAGQLSMLFRNVSQVGRVVPAFRLRATLDGEFWKEMEAVLDRMDG